MKFKLLCFLLIITVTACSKKVEKNAVVTGIDYKHWYRNYYKQLLTYKYIYEGQEYETTESLWKREAIYQLGDSAVIKIHIAKPEKSKLVGKVVYRLPKENKYPNYPKEPY